MGNKLIWIIGASLYIENKTYICNFIKDLGLIGIGLGVSYYINEIKAFTMFMYQWRGLKGNLHTNKFFAN